ncbi:heavy metal translocating P-type ATPase [Natronolimnohabitans innermongolicus]|uniref:Copper-translocating P-type ATPase n=1 Tax=Natronolimnohabitans innermongolicus JCM 12255 TaxID=1227499 RepID=L9WZY2_9EURY|nr:heavy metal translocating P-type ATPase [Natronolimnohabitans innermongolicus]ELY55039.1 copper-translocating P-type ATPase [Natronolimnohabitans innermongolicus JCM 12255]
MSESEHRHGDDGAESRDDGAKPTDGYCSCCRVCDCYRDAPEPDEKPDERREESNRAEHEAAHDHGDHVDHSDHEDMFRRRFFVCLVLSVPVLYYSPMLQDWFGFTAVTFPGSEFVGPVLGVVVFAYGGIPFLRMGAVEARNREPGMMLLISLAITVAFVYSVAAAAFDVGEPFFWELVTLIVIFLLGHWIEMRSVRRASGALDELAELLPETAERITEAGDTEAVPIDDLEADDLVLVRPGSNVPADGVVEEGESNVTEAMITGESAPVKKAPGDEVIGGTTNRDGSLRVRVAATGEETTLSGIMRLVEEAQESRSRTQVLADRAAGWLFYAALGVAAVTAVAWTVAVGFGLPVVERVVTVLVIACPHALGLAVPLVVAINTSMAARNGMLVRDRIAMEQARNLDTVVFDKTGTLTEGEQGVVEIAATDDWDEGDVLTLAAAVEGDSEHMIAQAIREEAAERGLSVPDVREFEALEGRGVRATIERDATPAVIGTDAGGSDGADPSDRDGHTASVGGPNLLRHLEIDPGADLERFADAAGERGDGVVYVLCDESVVGAVALADVIRDESVEAIDALHGMGVEVAMLTGDDADVAHSVADELGIDTVFAEVLPEDKDEKIVELQDRGHLVGMVGDGVNDAPALTRSDVGIAIGSGTDVAVESADVVLVENDPRDVASLVRLSKKSYRKMQENIVWAAGYNVFALPLAAGILAPVGLLLSPAVGAVLMSASTVIVAVNAQLLRRAELSV